MSAKAAISPLLVFRIQVTAVFFPLTSSKDGTEASKVIVPVLVIFFFVLVQNYIMQPILLMLFFS